MIMNFFKNNNWRYVVITREYNDLDDPVIKKGLEDYCDYIFKFER